jgi:hypothetical protein
MIAQHLAHAGARLVAQKIRWLAALHNGLPAVGTLVADGSQQVSHPAHIRQAGVVFYVVQQLLDAIYLALGKAPAARPSLPIQIKKGIVVELHTFARYEAAVRGY